MSEEDAAAVQSMMTMRNRLLDSDSLSSSCVCVVLANVMGSTGKDKKKETLQGEGGKL